MLVRYWKNGWYHARLVKRGWRWVTVEDLHLSRRKRGEKVVYEYRRRRVRRETVADAIWK